MEWNKFSESSNEFPEDIVQAAITGFPKATDFLAELMVTPKPEFKRITSKLPAQFQFDVDLRSQSLHSYMFRVFEFGYDIELFPVFLKIEESILSELNGEDFTYSNLSSIPTEEQFKLAIELIFKTERFNEVVSGLMKIARKHNSPF